MAKTAWGIEAGTSTVKAVRLSHDRAGVVIEDVAMIPLANYRTAGGDEQTALLGAFRQFVQEKGIRPTDICYVSLPGRNAFSRVISLPPVSEDAIRETIANEARGQIPIKLEEAVWDYQRITTDTGDVQVNLYAVKRDVVDTLLNTCRAAGLPVKGIQLAPLGIYNFLKQELDEAISSSCVCIDIGGENTDLLVVDGEKTYIRVVPTAGNDVSKTLLMKDRRLNVEQAEALKRNPQAIVKKLNEKGQDKIWKDVGSVFEAMKEPLRNLVSEILRSVGFYKNQNANASFDKLVIMGNGSRLLNIATFLKQQTEYDVHSISELTTIQTGRLVDPNYVHELTPSLVVPIGLALQALEIPGTTTTNLIPEDLIVEEQLGKVKPMAIAGGVIVFLAGLASFLMASVFTQSPSDIEDGVKSAVGKISARDKEWKSVIAGDAARVANFSSLSNAERGFHAPHASYVVLTELLAKIEKEEREARNLPDLQFFRTSMKRGSSDGDDTFRGVTTMMKETKLFAVADPALDTEERRYERSSTVAISANLALALQGIDRTTANTIATKVNEEVGKVFGVLHDSFKDEASARARFAEVFPGARAEVLDAMWSLHRLVSTKDTSAAAFASKVSLEGVLLTDGEVLTAAAIFPEKGTVGVVGRAIPEVEFKFQAKTMTYFNFRVRGELQLQPLRPVVESEEASNS